MNRIEDRKRLMRKAKRFVKPLVHTEFECPVCGGVASVNYLENVLRAECHACGLRKDES